MIPWCSGKCSAGRTAVQAWLPEANGHGAGLHPGTYRRLLGGRVFRLRGPRRLVFTPHSTHHNTHLDTHLDTHSKKQILPRPASAP